MHRLKLLLASALITVPIVGLAATQASSGTSRDVAVRTTVAVEGCCYVYVGGIWICQPC